MSRSAQILEDLIGQVLLGHRSLAGLEPAEAELLYITELLPCDGYGEDYFQARDEDGSETLVGYSQNGIVVKRLQGAPLKYRWVEIFKIASQKRNLLIRCAELSSIHFTMEDAEMARYVVGIFSLQLDFFRMYLWKAKSLQRLPSGAGDLQRKYKPGPFRSEMVPTNQVHSGQIIHPSITPICLISKPSLDTNFGSISQFSEINTEQTAPLYTLIVRPLIMQQLYINQA